VSVEETNKSKTMSKPVPAIRSVKARAVVVPLKRPVKNAFGVIDVGPLVLIDVETDQGVTGHSYIFAYTKLTLQPLVHLIEEIGRELTGKPVAPYDLMKAMDAKFRLLSWQGLVGMAVSGLDMACWDALGQIAGRPLAELLGGSPNRSRPMTAMAWSIRSPTRRRCAVRWNKVFAASRSRAATAMPPMTSGWSAACAPCSARISR
jgi:L-alanine-DL-glutamate epimerase-like enolase superfamily enzyme